MARDLLSLLEASGTVLAELSSWTRIQCFDEEEGALTTGSWTPTTADDQVRR